jgi:protein-tyrosine phosphatase
VIDIHTHLLPGVDDGSPTVEHSATVLARLHAEGVRAVVCTPHLNASQAAAGPYDQHGALLAALRERAPSGLTLHAGFEIMLDLPGADLGDPRLGLAGSRARLVEFPRRGLPPNATEELLRIRSAGLVPVIAHPERYRGATTETIDLWRELGAVIQCDAMALLGGGPMTEFARAMLASGQVDILASDNHGDRRSLSVACVWLSEIGAASQARILSNENPALLLSGAPLRAVPPVAMQRGVFDRLRELLFRSSRRTAGVPGDQAGA